MSKRFRSFLPVLLLLAALPGRVAAQWPPRMENLQVLPKTITVDSLISVMTEFTRSLGVGCRYCHVRGPGTSFQAYQFGSDDKPTKRKARAMLRMVNRINTVDLAELEDPSPSPVTVRCMTCHRGARAPRMLQEVLFEAYEDGGVDSLVVTYRDLRDRYYGRFTYDFGDVPLSDVGDRLVADDRLADAERTYELNLEFSPDSQLARRQLSLVVLVQAYLAGSDEVAATYDALTTRFGEPPTEDVVNETGFTFLRRDQPELALAPFRRNAEAHPTSSNVYRALALAHRALGNTGEAITNFAKAVELDPADADSAKQLEELLGGGGRESR